MNLTHCVAGFQPLSGMREKIHHRGRRQKPLCTSVISVVSSSGCPAATDKFAAVGLGPRRVTIVPALLWSTCLTMILLSCGPCLAALTDDVKSLLEQARTFEKAEDYRGAEQVYRQALTLAPNDPEVLKRCGILYQTELKFTDSIEVFQRALAASKQYRAVNFFTGVSYLGLNDFSKAAESFQAELATPQPHPRTHYYYAI